MGTGRRKVRDEISLHFWSLGLVLAVKELRESPPLNGMNTAREAEWIQKALVERWEPQRQESLAGRAGK